MRSILEVGSEQLHLFFGIQMAIFEKSPRYFFYYNEAVCIMKEGMLQNSSITNTRSANQNHLLIKEKEKKQ